MNVKITSLIAGTNPLNDKLLTYHGDMMRARSNFQGIVIRFIMDQSTQRSYNAFKINIMNCKGIYLDYKEAWIYIKGHRTRYKICSSGHVKNAKTGKYMSGGSDKNGYHIVSLTYNKKKYTRKVHRLVADAFISNPLNLPEVNHIDGDKWDNTVENLEWISSADNTHHAQRIGLRKCSLTVDTVHQICKLLESGKYKSKEISKMTEVDRSQIIKILNKHTWRSISEYYDFSKYDRSKSYSGSKNSNSVLNEKDVHKICKYLEKGYRIKDISDKLKITRHLISSIKRKQTWVHISKNYNF